MNSKVKETVSGEEWDTRVELAALYRLVAFYGWDDLVFTHISARVPNEPNNFLMNLYGMLFVFGLTIIDKSDPPSTKIDLKTDLQRRLNRFL